MVHMKAAARRDRVQQARHVEASWIGAHASHAELNAYMDQVIGGGEKLPPEALAGVIRSATSGLPTMTIEEFRKGQG
jgi:hypothetical protein